jgi:hypothetical protein
MIIKFLWYYIIIIIPTSIAVMLVFFQYLIRIYNMRGCITLRQFSLFNFTSILKIHLSLLETLGFEFLLGISVFTLQ